MANGRLEQRCENCGQTDDHPKLHYPPLTFHHDCIPAFVLDDIVSETDWQHEDGVGWVNKGRVPLVELPDHAKRVLAIRDKALSGVRGDKLLHHITSVMDHGQEG